VSRTAASLQKLDLSHLTPDDLRNVASLGAYWDTLGWVYAQSGNTEKLKTASRYTYAAWLLTLDGVAGNHLAQIYERLGQKEQAIHAYALALAAPRPDPDTRARLTLLLGGNAQIDELVQKARPELEALHSFSLKGLVKSNVAADFLILLSPEGTDGRSTKVESVKFVSGSASLRRFEEPLKSIDYGAMFPDGSPVKIIRQGKLSCPAGTGDCTFTLIPAGDMRASN
jgi:tetratricopeptide (TPR) repeat protein